MFRDKYLNLLTKHDKTDTLEVAVAINLVNDICDDYENRVCDNCNDSSVCDLYTDLVINPKYHISTSVFGCTEWGSKND